jgi:hypothetical protein
MPRLNDLESADRSKKRAAMRRAPIRSPAAHAERTLLILVLMQLKSTDKFKEVDARYQIKLEN